MTKPKKRSAAAKALALPIYRQRIVKSKKIYSRKGRRKLEPR